MTRLLTRLSAVLLAIFAAHQAYAVTTTGHASATVASALSISETTELSFGAFTSGTTAGTVTTAGVSTGGVTYLSGAREGSFTLNGGANVPVTINGESPITLSSGSDSMRAALGFPPTVTLNGAGVGTLNVSGTLTVAANQPAGTYNGTYTVTVSY